ncbi:Translin [Coniochaeta ligniaria NRRL 30616]|uniref:Translin n=1 Tax=Coniochaeta ligniaria NRRL 30616 TaxID=1408157 RepID=A0A1J7IL04_9PEZI|nr:Translin [Coniochaeta ligniaria NRRL 30616]
MSGLKRDHQGNEKQKPHEGARKTVPVVRNEYTPMFEQFRNELDHHHERREKIVKASRDITALSKKIIFALQRVRKIQQDLPNDIKKDMEARLDQISKLLASIARETQGINRYRYSNNLSCMEELVEALTFAHYLRTQSLVSYDELSAEIESLAQRGATPEDDAVVKAQPDANMPEITPSESSQATAGTVEDPVVSITVQDYIYGVFDLTGEMMRFATTSTALTRSLATADGDDASARPRTILQDMQDLRSFVEMLPQSKGRSWTQKLQVLRQSVRKVELIGYGMVVRGGERAKGWVPDAEVDADPDE